MAKGRPCKPLKYHDLHGTLRADRHGQKEDQYRPTGVPVKPDDLDDTASAFWDTAVTQLIADGVAATIDGTLLTEMCQWFSLYKKHQKALLNPELDSRAYYITMIQSRMAWKEFNALAGAFGLSPAARSKLAIGIAQKHNGIISRNRQSEGA